MTTPLWTDGRIKGALIGNLLIDSEVTPVLDEGAALNMRDEYEAEIARLKAQLATTWQPVADGDAIIPKRSLYKGLGIDGNRLYITQTNGAKDSIYLTEDLRLCRKVKR